TSPSATRVTPTCRSNIERRSTWTSQARLPSSPLTVEKPLRSTAKLLTVVDWRSCTHRRSDPIVWLLPRRRRKGEAERQTDRELPVRRSPTDAAPDPSVEKHVLRRRVPGDAEEC